MASEFLKQMAQRQAQRIGVASPFLRTMAAMQAERVKEQVTALPERQTVPATTATVSSSPFTAPLEFRDAERRNLAQNANVLASMATHQTMPDYYSNEYGDILRQRLREAELESGKYAGLAAPALNMTPEFIDTYNKAMQAQRALQQAKSEYEQWQRDVYNKQQEQKIGQIEVVLNRPDAQTLAQSFDPKKISVSGKYAGTKSKVKYALDDQYRTQIHAGAMAGGGVGDFAKYAQLNENEKNVLRYYAAQDDWEGAEQYLKALERVLNERETQRIVKSERETAEKYPGIGAISNILSGFGVPASIAATAAQYINNAVTGEQAPADIYSPWYRAAHIQRASGEGVQNAAYKAALEATGSEAVAAVASFVAGTGLSIGNFLTKVPLGPAALPYMGLQAAGSTALEAQERGAAAGTAFLLGSAAGLIEAATEKLPLENLMKLGKAGKRKVVEVLRQTAQQAAIEATEETISEVANTIVDIAVMGDKSGFNEYVKYLEQQGYDPQKARAEALFQYFAVNPLQAAAGGALSGGVTGFIFSTIGDARGRNADAQAEIQQAAVAPQNATESVEQPANISTFTAPKTAQDAAQTARQTVVDILAGQVSNSKADTIVKTPVLAQAFREVTGIELSGTAAQRRAQVKAAATRFTQNAPQAVETEVQQAVQHEEDGTVKSAGTLLANPSTLTGYVDETYTANNEPVRFRYAIVSADSLIASHDRYGNINADYPAELQPRDRSRMTSQLQIDAMSKSLNPRRLAESAEAQNGAPIVRDDGVVIGGNGRVVAIKAAYDSGYSAQYEQYLRENAQRFGITGELPPKPVLVRVVEGVQDYENLAKRLNETSTATYSATESAVEDAKKMGDILDLFVPNDDGKINTSDNRSFINAFVSKVVPAAEQGSVITKDGYLSQVGLTRVRNAIFAAAYGDTGLLVKLSEDTDDNTKNITNALLHSAPNAVYVRRGIDTGEFYDVNIIDDVVQAAHLYMYARSRGLTIDEVVSQSSLLHEYSLEAIALATFMQTNKRSAKNIRIFLNELYNAIPKFGSPMNYSLLGDGEDATKRNAIQIATERYKQILNITDNSKVGFDYEGYLRESAARDSAGGEENLGGNEAGREGGQAALADNRKAEVGSAATGPAGGTEAGLTQDEIPRGAGAAERGFSRLIVPTQSKAADSLFTEAERGIHSQIGSPTHIRYTNEASMLDATRMLKHDYEGTKKRLAEPGTAWGAAETVAARQILADLTEEASSGHPFTSKVQKFFEIKKILVDTRSGNMYYDSAYTHQNTAHNFQYRASFSILVYFCALSLRRIHNITNFAQYQ